MGKFNNTKYKKIYEAVSELETNNKTGLRIVCTSKRERESVIRGLEKYFPNYTITKTETATILVFKR